MKLTTLLTLGAVVALAYGLCLLVLPLNLLSLYGITTGAAQLFLARLLGAACGVMGLLLWSARSFTEVAARRAFVRAFLVYNVAGLVLSILGVTGGVMNAVGWSTVVIHAFFGIGFAAHQLRKTEPA
jgi:hypothetical protein